MLTGLSQIVSTLIERRLTAIPFATLAFITCTAGGATFTLSPSATSNTYGGVLTLQITGLTNTEPVIVQTYLDANANGVVDGSDLLVDEFRINESGISIIGGATNINVPYDSNSATDAITATLSLAASVERIVGQEIFRLVSPTGRFTTQTAIFTVTNAAGNPSVSGTVFNGTLGVSNAVVVALSQPDNNFAGAVLTDNTGHYQLRLKPGTYGVLPTAANYYTDQSLVAVVTLTNGGSVVANLFVTNGAPGNTISGLVLDATNASAVGGAFLQLQSGNLFAIAFADASGHYSAALNPSFWRARLDGNRLTRRAYVVPNNQPQADLTTGSVASVSFALPKANALFYGRVANTSNAPLANVVFFGEDELGQFQADGFGDLNGNYAVGVLADGTNMWRCQTSTGESEVLRGYLVSAGLGSTNLSPGQAVRQDFTVLRATAQISGRVQDNLGNPVSNLGIGGNASIGGISYTTFSDSDGSGNYLVPAAPGFWQLYVNCCGNDGLESRGLYDPGMHFVSIPPTNAILNITVLPIGTPFLSQPRRMSSSQFGFNLSGAQGVNYTIQFSTDLSHWTNLFSLQLTSNPMFLQDNSATNSRRWYRAQKN